MPPTIYKSGLFVSNYPTGRQYIHAGEAYIAGQFSPFTATFKTGSSSIHIAMPSFDVTLSSESDNIQFAFPVFGASFTSNAGSVSTLDITFPSFLSSFGAGDISLEATTYAVSAEGTCYQLQTISLDSEAINIALDGGISASVTIIAPDPEEGSDSDVAIVFEGDVYIVLNLKTKSHTTYMDGNNNAIAQTGELSLGGSNYKNVSDAYLLSRATGTPELIVKNNEETERTYDISYGEAGQAVLRNKKLPLAKGLRGSNWQFSVVSTEDNHLEVRGIELIVNKLKRRV